MRRGALARSFGLTTQGLHGDRRGHIALTRIDVALDGAVHQLSVEQAPTVRLPPLATVQRAVDNDLVNKTGRQGTITYYYATLRYGEGAALRCTLLVKHKDGIEASVRPAPHDVPWGCGEEESEVVVDPRVTPGTATRQKS